MYTPPARKAQQDIADRVRKKREEQLAADNEPTEEFPLCRGGHILHPHRPRHWPSTQEETLAMIRIKLYRNRDLESCPS